MTENNTQAAECLSHLTAELDTTSDVIDVNALLLPALRQYQHNDCSGFVAGYDHAETQKIVVMLLKQQKQQLIAKCIANLRNVKVSGKAFDRLVSVFVANISV